MSFSSYLLNRFFFFTLSTKYSDNYITSNLWDLLRSTLWLSIWSTVVYITYGFEKICALCMGIVFCWVCYSKYVLVKCWIYFLIIYDHQLLRNVQVYHNYICSCNSVSFDYDFEPLTLGTKLKFFYIFLMKWK